MMRAAYRWLATLVAVVPMAMMIVTCLDVVGRRFDRPLPGAIEMIELAMGLLVFGALPLVTADREHVTVGLLDHRLSPRWRRVRDAAVAAISAAVVGVIAWRLALKAVEAASFGDRSTYLGVPMAALTWFMAGAAALAAGVLVAQAASGEEPGR